MVVIGISAFMGTEDEFASYVFPFAILYGILLVLTFLSIRYNIQWATILLLGVMLMMLDPQLGGLGLMVLALVFAITGNTKLALVSMVMIIVSLAIAAVFTSATLSVPMNYKEWI